MPDLDPKPLLQSRAMTLLAGRELEMETIHFYYWMNLESGKVMRFPTGWDLNYFSADQRRAVFENIQPTP